MLKLLVIAGAMSLGLATAAAAETPCKGAQPQPGAVLHGPVLYVAGGGRLCVARAFSPDAWIELQLADAPPDLSRGALMSAAFARNVDCRVGAEGRAVCTLEGQSVGALAQRPAVQKAGLDWR